MKLLKTLNKKKKKKIRKQSKKTKCKTLSYINKTPAIVKQEPPTKRLSTPESSESISKNEKHQDLIEK